MLLRSDRWSGFCCCSGQLKFGLLWFPSCVWLTDQQTRLKWLASPHLKHLRPCAVFRLPNITVISFNGLRDSDSNPSRYLAAFLLARPPPSSANSGRAYVHFWGWGMLVLSSSWQRRPKGLQPNYNTRSTFSLIFRFRYNTQYTIYTQASSNYLASGTKLKFCPDFSQSNSF